MEVASKQDVENIVDRKLEDVQRNLMNAIEQIGKPELMTLDEVAENWGITKRYASKRLKEMYQRGDIKTVDFDHRPITVSRKEFIEAISK